MRLSTSITSFHAFIVFFLTSSTIGPVEVAIDTTYRSGGQKSTIEVSQPGKSSGIVKISLF